MRARTPVRLAAAALGLGLAACANLDTVIAPDTVLTLTATPQSLPANGFATATIVAEIDPRSDERFRDIGFFTTQGSFPAGTSSRATSIVATANSEGRAIVTLQAAAQVGVATVTAEIRDGDAVKVSRTLDIPFETVPPSDVIVLNVGSAEAPADGASVTDVVARIASNVPNAQRLITFATSLGTFGGGNASSLQALADSSNEARVGLVSPREPGTAIVTATLNGLTARGSVLFTPALPHSMSLSIQGNFKISASFSSKVALSADLYRGTGTVTRGTEVSFSATDDSTGRSFGFFSGVTPSDAQGKVSADFTPGNTDERGEATLTARVRGANVRSSVKIEIVDP
jgi:hypothetical protein